MERSRIALWFLIFCLHMCTSSLKVGFWEFPNVNVVCVAIAIWYALDPSSTLKIKSDYISYNAVAKKNYFNEDD